MNLKRLERWWRGLWIRLLVRLMRRPSDARPDWRSRPSRVLFLRHDRAGDMILSTGVMRAIVRAHPTMTMDVLASPVNAPILVANDYLGDVIVFDKKRLATYLPVARRLRRARYDAVIDCMVTAPSVTTLLLMLASGARYRVGIAGRGNDAAFNVLAPPETDPAAHMVDHLAALARGFGLELSESERQPVIMLSAPERSAAESTWGARDGGRRVLINVSAGTSHRVWAESKYVAVMQHLRERDPAVTIRVIGAPSERVRAERVASGGGGTLVATPTLRDALALVATSDFVLSPDTSISHAASAFGIPTVAMLVRGSAQRWGLYGTIGESVENADPNLETLSVDRVIAAVDAVLSAAALSRR
jgi:ADP-heptose:LPS heptosyltransferase